MDNGVGVAVIENQVVGIEDARNKSLEKIEKRVHEPSDSEGDEVFEEATDKQGHFQEQQLKTVSDDIPCNQGIVVEMIPDLASLNADGNSSAGQEVEAFQEAIEDPGDAGIGEELPHLIEENRQNLVDGDPVDGESVTDRKSFDDVLVVSGNPVEEAFIGTVDEEGAGQLNDSMNDGLLLHRKLASLDTYNVAGNGRMEELKNGNEVGDNPAVVLTKSENGESGNVNFEGGPVLEQSENGDAFEVREEVPFFSLDAKFNGEIVLPDDTSEHLKLKMDKLSSEDDKGVELENSPGGLLSDKGKNVCDNFTDLDASFPGDGSGEVKAAFAIPDVAQVDGKVEEVKDALHPLVEESQDNKSGEVEDASAIPDIVLVDGKVEEVKDTEPTLADEGEDNKGGEVKNIAAIPDLVLGDCKIEEVEENLSTLVKEGQDNRSAELKDISAITHPEHNGDRAQASDHSNNLHNSSEEGKAIPEPSDIENKETLQVGASDLGPRNAEVSRSRCTTEDVEYRDIQEIAEEPKRNTAADKEKKQHDDRNREREIQPATQATSVSRKSEDPAPPPARPAGLGRAAPLLEPAPRAVHQPRVNGSFSQNQSQLTEDTANGEAEEADETREKLQMIRVKFLRLAHRLGQTPHNVVVAQVLYRLGLAEQLRGRNGGRTGAFSFDRASAMAEQLEAAGQEPLDFSCTILVLGKTGVGKSATINSIFDELKFSTDAFELGTKKVQDVIGTVQGIKVRVIDTPGLLSSGSDQRQNEKTLHSVKRFIKKTPPDIVLYLDRLDMQSREFGDMPLLRTITEIFGQSIWFNAIVVLTHAASAPPDGPNGTASSYDMFVTQRSHVVQQAIRQAAGDMRLMNPVSLVENHSACRTNRAGQRVLPNGQVWKPHLLLLSFASKILAEANALLKLQDSPPGKPFATRSRAPPLPFLLSSLIQSRPQLKLPEDQSGDDDTLDDDLDESSDSDNESEYDELPPFKSLTKAQLEKLTKQQKKAYFDELEYRENLFMKKQLKEERRRRRMMKKMAASAKDMAGEYSENVEEESGGTASVPVPMPDLALPASFDSDNPTHRYRFLDSSNQWLVRPVLETHGWDHDVGYEGINAERLFVVKDKIPLSLSGQVTKDKKDASLQLEVASSIKHGKGKATSLGFDMQTVGKDMIYTMRSETRFSNYRKNKATAGLSVTLLGDAVSTGVKLEDKVIVNKRFQFVVTGGAMTGRGDVAYGGSLEATLRDKDYPLGRSLSTLGLSIMDWHGDLAIGGNIQSQIPIGRSTNMIARANLNNKGSGQVSIRLNSSEQWQIVLIGFIPLIRKLLDIHQQNQY